MGYIVDRRKSVGVLLSKDLLLTIKSTLRPLQGFAVLPLLIKLISYIVDRRESRGVLLSKGLLLTIKNMLIPLQGFVVLPLLMK